MVTQLCNAPLDQESVLMADKNLEGASEAQLEEDALQGATDMALESFARAIGVDPEAFQSAMKGTGDVLLKTQGDEFPEWETLLNWVGPEGSEYRVQRLKPRC